MKSWPEWRLRAGFDEWMESPEAKGLHLVITREILTNSHPCCGSRRIDNDEMSKKALKPALPVSRLP